VAATFFKHAQRDADAELTFWPGINEPLIMFSVMGLRRMGVAGGAEEFAFGHWLALHRPDWITEDGSYDSIHADYFKNFGGLDKKEFFELCELAWRQRGNAAS